MPSSVSRGLAYVFMKPCRRFLEKSKVGLLKVVGVAGGDEGPTNLKFGVVGLMIAAVEVEYRLYTLYEARSRRQRPWQISSPTGRGNSSRGIAVHDK